LRAALAAWGFSRAVDTSTAIACAAHIPAFRPERASFLTGGATWTIWVSQGQSSSRENVYA
jgi:S-formylglutathione hydrolase FrmB